MFKFINWNDKAKNTVCESLTLIDYFQNISTQTSTEPKLAERESITCYESIYFMSIKCNVRAVCVIALGLGWM